MKKFKSNQILNNNDRSELKAVVGESTAIFLEDLVLQGNHLWLFESRAEVLGYDQSHGCLNRQEIAKALEQFDQGAQWVSLINKPQWQWQGH